MAGNIIMPSPLRLQGTSSWAESASIAITASYALNAGGNLSGGTERYISLWSSTSTLTTSSLYQDTSGRIGIGTTTPSGALNINTTQSFAWNATSTAGFIIGDKVSGSSLIVRTPGYDGVVDYDSGLVINGSYIGDIGGKSEVNLTAFGVFSGGGYHSDMVFRTTYLTSIYEMMRLSQDNGNPIIYMTGSLQLSGSSHTISGSLNGNFTGSLQGTSSWAVSASVAISASRAVSASFALSSSYALSASIATTSSYLTTLKAGSASIASFTGNPSSSAITFGSAFSNNIYAVTVTGEDARSWTIQSKSNTGFTINSNSTVALTGPVYWIATPFN
jgi:hypothetical protein